MTSDSFDSAIAQAFIRPHPDKPLSLHPNGVENKSWSCPSVHINILLAVRTMAPVFQHLPLG